MELFALLIGLFFLITIFMPWVNSSRFSGLRDDVESLQRRIRDLEDRLCGVEGGKAVKTQPLRQRPEAAQDSPGTYVSGEDREEWAARTGHLQEEPPPEEAFTTLENSETPVSSVPYVAKTDWVQKAQNTFEQNIATKLPVWIGALSLICAAFFLVKYSIEHSWLGPTARISLGVLFGGGLLSAGQWIGRREHIANSARIGQGLIGAGLVALYVSVYAAIHLYGLLPPLLGFASMSAITALAVILSLRHGQPIAVFGLLGGLLTPALIGSDEPNAIAMFTYLFLLFSGMFTVLARKGWWALAVISVIGVFCWSGLWFLLVFAASDAFVLVLFAMAVTAVVLAVTGRRVAENTLEDTEKLPVHGLNFTAIAGGVLTIIWLGFEITLTLFDWSMLGLLSIAVMALAYFQPGVYQKPLWVKLGANLILFFIWAQDAPLADTLAVLAGISAIYVGGGALLMRRVQDPRFWAGVQAVAALALYVLSYFVLDLPAAFTEGFGMFWGITSLILASLAIYQATDIRGKYSADAVIREHLVAIFALAASAFISLGMAIELPWSYVPLAIAGQITATAWVYQRTRIDFLKKIMLILTLVFAGLNYEQIALFSELIVDSLIGDTPSARYIGSYVLDAALVKLGIPAALIFLALWLTGKSEGPDSGAFHNILFGTATLLAMASAYYVFRGALYADHINIFATRAGFIERGIITIACAGAGIGLLQLSKRCGAAFIRPWGYGLFHLGILRFAYFDFFAGNPYWSGAEFVGDMPLFNGVTLTYGIGGLLAVWAIYNEELKSKKVLYKTLGFAALFAFASFTVRQYFHGGHMMQGSVSAAELYAYSVAWLATGLGLLALGIIKQNKTARMASLAFVILAVLKVFLFDAAELEGLYRVFSFLGLGVSLIGLSYFYTKFAFGDRQAGKDA